MENCYALSVGFGEGVLERLGATDGLYRNHNYEAALFGQGALEMGQLLRLQGGRPETAYGLAGVGDMYVTSAGGPNIRVGRLIGVGMTFSEADAKLGHITLEGRSRDPGDRQCPAAAHRIDGPTTPVTATARASGSCETLAPAPGQSIFVIGSPISDVNMMSFVMSTMKSGAFEASSSPCELAGFLFV
jgi:hypothetical protein